MRSTVSHQPCLDADETNCPLGGEGVRQHRLWQHIRSGQATRSSARSTRLSCRIVSIGPKHRLDVTFRGIGDAAARDLPHGIIGSRCRRRTSGLEAEGKRTPWSSCRSVFLVTKNAQRQEGSLPLARQRGPGEGVRVAEEPLETTRTPRLRGGLVAVSQPQRYQH